MADPTRRLLLQAAQSLSSHYVEWQAEEHIMAIGDPRSHIQELRLDALETSSLSSDSSGGFVVECFQGFLPRKLKRG